MFCRGESCLGKGQNSHLKSCASGEMAASMSSTAVRGVGRYPATRRGQQRQELAHAERQLARSRGASLAVPCLRRAFCRTRCSNDRPRGTFHSPTACHDVKEQGGYLYRARSINKHLLPPALPFVRRATMSELRCLRVSQVG